MLQMNECQIITNIISLNDTDICRSLILLKNVFQNEHHKKNISLFLESNDTHFFLNSIIQIKPENKYFAIIGIRSSFLWYKPSSILFHLFQNIFSASSVWSPRDTRLQGTWRIRQLVISQY